VDELVACWQSLPLLQEEDLVRRLDLSSCILVGHSFGATSALIASERSEFPSTALVMLDPWIGPGKQLIQKPSAPTLAIMTGSMLYPENTRDLVNVLDLVKRAQPLCGFAEVELARHMDQSDIGFILRWPLAFLSSCSMLRSGKMLLKANLDVMLHFIDIATSSRGVVDDLRPICGVRFHDFTAWNIKRG